MGIKSVSYLALFDSARDVMYALDYDKTTASTFLAL